MKSIGALGAVALFLGVQASAQPALRLAEGHWAHGAAAWLAARGLTGPLPPWSPSTWAEVRARFVAAESLAATDASPVLAKVAKGWDERFRLETGARVGAGGSRVLLGVSTAWRRGIAAPQRSFAAEPRPVLLPPEDYYRGLADVAAYGGPFFAQARLEWERSAPVSSLEFGLQAGRWRVAAGRTPIGYGPGRGHGLVFGGAVPIDQVSVETLAPLRLPVGTVRAHTFLGRFRRSQNPRRPFVWGGAIAWQPHRRLQLAVLRGAMFAGDSAREKFSLRQFARVVVPLRNTGEENHVYSFAVWYRPPLERWWPLSVSLEWGADDSAGALDERPGVRMELYTPLSNGAGVGLTATRLGTRPALGFTGHGAWYHHGSALGPWIAEAQPLGVALGGELSELQGYAHGTAAAGRAWWGAAVGLRRRSVDNLFAPLREGRSWLTTIDGSWRLTSQLEGRTSISMEWGNGWTSRDVRIEASWRLH